jgi:hypothetical protein
MTTALLTTLLLAPPTLTVRVEGDGYLRLAKDGRLAYATTVTLTEVSGALGTTDGQLILPRLPMSASAKALAVDLEGNVQVDGSKIGRLVLALFPKGKVAKGVAPKLGNPGEGVNGVIRTDAAPATPETPKVSKVPEAKVLVIVRLNSEIDGEKIRLGDVATIDGDVALVERLAGLDLGASPLLGTSRGIAKTSLLSRIRFAGIDPKSVDLQVPEGATVARKSQLIPADTLVQTASDAIRKRLGVNTDFVAVKPPSPITAPPGDFEAVAEPGTTSSNGVPVTVTVRVGGKPVGSRLIVLMPATGSVGVRAGEEIRVRLLCNGAVVELEGKAGANGWIGQTVTLTASVTPNGRPTTLSGTVVAEGLVEVKL